MTVPVLENGPWVFNVNNTFTASGSWTIARTQVLGIKNGLVALGGAGVIWQVVASSDSVSVKNIGDADPDLWIDTDDLVATSSWVILENQTTGAQFLIDWSYNAAYYWTLVFSPDGTFNTDGTTSNPPTSTDGHAFWENAPDFNLNLSEYNNFAVHIMTSANHATLRIFVVSKSDTTGGKHGALALLIEDVANTPAIWSSTYKYVVFHNSSNVTASTIVTSQSPTMAEFDGQNWYAHLETTEPYSGWLSCYPTAECYGNLYQNGGKILCYNSVSQEFPGGYPVSPIGLFRGNPYGGSFGRLQDLYFAPNTHGMLDTYPADSSRSWAKVGCLLVPWNGTQPQGL